MPGASEEAAPGPGSICTRPPTPTAPALCFGNAGPEPGAGVWAWGWGVVLLPHSPPTWSLTYFDRLK